MRVCHGKKKEKKEKECERLIVECAGVWSALSSFRVLDGNTIRMFTASWESMDMA